MSNKYTILIIEDENSISSILKMVFTANGYNAYTGINGSECMIMVI